MIDFATARMNMVECQLRPNRVTDEQLLKAFATLPRELFVPSTHASYAYVDDDISLEGGRSLMEPMVLARLLQAAQVRPTDIVLVIGPATGYSAALLGRLAGTVVALESETNFAERANAICTKLGADNVVVVRGPLADGYLAQAPYDLILLDGAIPQIPDKILTQLSPDGRLVAVLAPPGQTARAVLARRHEGGVFGTKVLFDATVPNLPGFASKPQFVL
jgi:protein-L-isoaspartate(D-aspartate) O-methyltransferase